MRQETFTVLQALAEKHTGQFLHANKPLLFAGRLTGLTYRTGHDTIDELARYIGDFRPGSNLELEVATALLDPRSRFVSERLELTPLFEQVIVPALERTSPGPYRIWCAGCGSGQEAFSLLMMLNNNLPGDRFRRIDLIATDISEAALIRANKGLYSHFDVQVGLSAHNLVRYFTQAPEQRWQVSPVLARQVQFQAHNLLSSEDAPGRFDLILCRHVLGGMTPEHRQHAEQVLHRHLTPAGHLHIIE
ncbi:CheR family methyltransferase [uncultured Hyphomonas sp.]|uniref:CheR family methyltransferase n=1 Tax=uncultured Hyphomonas sp. TaxID=225298 RepID=UPI002AAC25D9|nr:CheR family methyltransferase [uncultured Hyphomonas sp.]